MALEIVRRIRGNVHGSVDITLLENKVIAHPYFQRLRRIKQLAFLHYVFPGATHSRFEHSLGVMHMAGLAWDKLQKNQERLRGTLLRTPHFDEIERSHEGIIHGLLTPTFGDIEPLFGSDEVLQAMRLAGLMHDLGHPPFSHSGERFLPSWYEMLATNRSYPPYLRQYVEEQCDRLSAEGKDPKEVGVRHEVVSMFMVERVLQDIYREKASLPLEIEPRDVVAIISKGISPSKGSPLLKLNAYRVCRELISGELDIDRMDYLLRDSRECGVVYGIFDAGRILDSLCLYHDPEDKSHHIGITFAGLAAFEDYLRARHSMYLQLYFHKTSVAAEAMMQEISALLGGYRLPASIEAYASYDEYNIGPELIIAAQSLPTALRARLEDLTRGLLYNRQLWKRVYEVTGSDRGIENAPEMMKAKRLLSGMGVTYQQVSSVGSLTRFRPRNADEKSTNYLRLIKKDERQIPRVCPIEDYCQLIHQNSSTYISRIYVDAEIADRAKVRENIQRRLMSTE